MNIFPSNALSCSNMDGKTCNEAEGRQGKAGKSTGDYSHYDLNDYYW